MMAEVSEGTVARLKKTAAGGGQPKPKNKARAGPGFRTLGIRVTDEYAAWLERAAKHDRVTIAAFLDRAAADRAREIGFGEAPPERLP